MTYRSATSAPRRLRRRSGLVGQRHGPASLLRQLGSVAGGLRLLPHLLPRGDRRARRPARPRARDRRAQSEPAELGPCPRTCSRRWCRRAGRAQAAVIVGHRGYGSTLGAMIQACRWSSCRCSPTSPTTPRDRGAERRDRAAQFAHACAAFEDGPRRSAGSAAPFRPSARPVLPARGSRRGGRGALAAAGRARGAAGAAGGGRRGAPGRPPDAPALATISGGVRGRSIQLARVLGSASGRRQLFVVLFLIIYG